MFPVIDSDWTSYLINALPNSVSPCWVDIVGNSTFPAGYYYTDPKGNLNPTEVSFRMRLNGDPIKNNPNLYELNEFVWGVQVRDNTNALLYTIRVNASGDNYVLQVLNSASTVIHTEPIAISNPFQNTDNVRVTFAGANFPCSNPNVDDDFFLDFKVQTSVFTGFNFVSSTYKLCYYTSTQDNDINKDFICGDVLNPPAGQPILCVSKLKLVGPSALCTNQSGLWVLSVTVLNCGTVAVNGITLTDFISPDITLNNPPTISPAAAVFTPPKTITWNIGNLAAGGSQTLMVVLDGKFTTTGDKVLDAGTVTSANAATVNFSNGLVTVNDNSQLSVTKQITSGPFNVNVCQTSRWTFLITVQNKGNTDLTGIIINDTINNSFEIENMTVDVSRGSAVVNGSNIIWTIDVLSAASSETMTITLDGFFESAGLQIFDSGTAAGLCTTIPFSDTGITVKPKPSNGLVEVSGYMRDCKIKSLLDDVKVNVYDNNCKLIETDTFDKKYSLNLKQGMYVIEFIKDDYVTKYIALVIESDLAVYHDIFMLKKSSSVPVSTDTNIKDIFVNIIKQRVDVDIVISNSTCINTNAKIECLCDVVDSLNYEVICKTKLYLRLQLEKDIVYKLNDVKNLKTNIWQYAFCFPVSEDDITDFDYVQKYKVKDVFFCKDGNTVYNVPFISYSGYFVERQDVLINSDTEI